MMDIVKRLRAKADTYANRIECAASLECEAADTIDALREVLRECNSILSDLTSGTPCPNNTDIMAHYERCVRAELSSRKALTKVQS
jgi:hypothetical protein